MVLTGWSRHFSTLYTKKHEHHWENGHDVSIKNKEITVTFDNFTWMPKYLTFNLLWYSIIVTIKQIPTIFSLIITVLFLFKLLKPDLTYLYCLSCKALTFTVSLCFISSWAFVGGCYSTVRVQFNIQYEPDICSS